LERGADPRPMAHLLGYVDQLLAAFTKQDRQEDEPKPQPPTAKPQTSFALLSERELEVLPLLAAGASNQEISERLVVSPNTVKPHVHNMFNKLGLNTRTQAVARARELGLL